MKKRILSLILSLACVLALSIPAYAADPVAFTDATEIEHWEPVAVLAQLEIIHGREDGSFAADQFLTGAEAAKLLCVMGLGGKEETLGQLTTAQDSPYAGHWAGKYMDWCGEAGLLAWEGNVFTPEGPVGYAQLTRMCLILLGYDPDVFALTGPDWELNTNSLAFGRMGLGDGLDIVGLDTSEPLTRDQAAQILCNTLKEAPLVKDPSDSEAAVFALKPARNADGTPQTLLQANFNLDQLPPIPAQPEK